MRTRGSCWLGFLFVERVTVRLTRTLSQPMDGWTGNCYSVKLGYYMISIISIMIDTKYQFINNAIWEELKMTVVVITNVKDATKRILSMLPKEYDQVNIIVIRGSEWINGEFSSTFLGKPVDLILFDLSISVDINEQELLTSVSTMYEVGKILRRADGTKAPVKFISTTEGLAILTVRQLAMHMLLLSTIVGECEPTIAALDGYSNIYVDEFGLFDSNGHPALAIINC